MRPWVAGAVVVLLWMAAWWRVPALPGPWGVPDGLLLVLLAWAFACRTTPPVTAALGVGIFLGVLKDLASGGPSGGWTAIFAGMAWLATRVARTIARDHPATQVAWVTVCAMGTTGAYAFLLGLRGEWGVGAPILGYFLLPSAVATAVASLLLFPLLQRLF